MIPTPTAQLGREVRRLPPVVLRERLAAARRAGISFQEAWPGALDAAVNASMGARGVASSAFGHGRGVARWMGAPARHKDASMLSRACWRACCRGRGRGIA